MSPFPTSGKLQITTLANQSGIKVVEDAMSGYFARVTIIPLFHGAWDLAKKTPSVSKLGVASKEVRSSGLISF
jgi:hypothetical protein